MGELTELELAMLRAHLSLGSLEGHLRASLVGKGYLKERLSAGDAFSLHRSYAITDKGRKALEAQDE